MALGGMALAPATVFAEGPSDFKVCHGASMDFNNFSNSTIAKTHLR